MAGAIFNEIAILLSFSVLLGFIAIKLRQPLILSFIIVGIIAGPSVFGWITSETEIELFAKIGVTLLLFIVGLKLDIDLIRTFGFVAILIGMGQIILTAIAGFGLGLILGFESIDAIYIAVCLTFSSTIIIVKMLSDRYEIDSLYGRLAVGILIVQDLVVIFAIIVLSSFGRNQNLHASLQFEVISMMLKGIGFLALIGLLMRFVLPFMLEHLARSRELLILFAIAWAVVLAGFGDLLGFSQEVGGFLAGVSLATTRYREAITSRLETLRNFLLLFFFLNLGASIHLSDLKAQMGSVLIFSLFVLIVKPFIVMILMGIMRFRKRTGFLAGISIAQISEFSLILAALGESLGHIDENITGLITIIGLVTIGLSTYIMAYSSDIYNKVSSWLGIFERQVSYREDVHEKKSMDLIDVIIYGFGRHGEHIAKILDANGWSVMGIDFDPRRWNLWHNHPRIRIRYGDAEDMEFSKTLPLQGVQWIVSTIGHFEANQTLLASLREMDYQGKIAVSANHESAIEAFQKLHADLVIIPYKDAAFLAAQKIMENIKLRS